jgi:hypothetical protein
VTDGAGSIGQRVWYQPRSVRFTKVCN